MSEYKKVEEDDLKSLNPNLTPKELAQVSRDEEITCARVCASLSMILVIIFLISLFIYMVTDERPPIPKYQVLVIKIISIDFVAEFDDNNSTTTQQSCHLPDLVSARWDLLIRVPGNYVGNFICLQGNLQASFLYKNITLVTSSIQSYNKLELGVPQLLNVSVVATKKDFSGAIGKDIVDAIKERNEVRFGSRLSITDCRAETKKGTMSFECEEAKLRFEPGSDQIKATTFGNHPTCDFIIYL